MQRRDELIATQQGLGALADATGGLFFRNTNDIGGALSRALADQHGYYLLGYVPDRSTFADRSPRFHSLRIRVKRPGLLVRSRRGFLGRPDQDVAPRTPETRMLDAVSSPFAGGDMRLRLSSLFAQAPEAGPMVYSFMHVDTRDLTMVEQPDGSRVAEVETLAVTFGEDGQLIDQHGRRYTMTVPADSYARALASGLVYGMRVSVKTAWTLPAPYRVARRGERPNRRGQSLRRGAGRRRVGD